MKFIHFKTRFLLVILFTILGLGWSENVGAQTGGTPPVTCNVTYNYMFSGDLKPKFTETLSTSKTGSKWPTATYSHFGITYTQPSDAIPTDPTATTSTNYTASANYTDSRGSTKRLSSYDITYTITLSENDTWKSMATSSATQLSDITTWFTLRMQANYGYYVYNNGGTAAFNNSENTKNEYLWALVGNPYEFKVYNYKAGFNNTLHLSDGVGVLTADDETTYEAVDPSTTGSVITANGFCLKINNTSNYLNYQDGSDGTQYAEGKIKTWTGNDAGSTFCVGTAVSPTPYYRIKNNNTYWVSLGNENYVDPTDGSIKLKSGTDPNVQSSVWYLETTDDGIYRFHNYMLGDDYVLKITGSEQNARATMVPATNTDETTYFNGTFNFDGPSYIKIATTDNNYLNNRDSYLALWNTSWADGNSGSSLYFEEIDPSTLSIGEYTVSVSGLPETETGGGITCNGTSYGHGDGCPVCTGYTVNDVEGYLSTTTVVANLIKVGYIPEYTYIKNKNADVYMGFDPTSTDGKTYNENATPLGTRTVFKVSGNQTDGFTISDTEGTTYVIYDVDGGCGWNTAASSTAKTWSINFADTYGYFYIQKDADKYLKVNDGQTTGYAYTDGSSTNKQIDWIFEKAEKKDYKVYIYNTSYATEETILVRGNEVSNEGTTGPIWEVLEKDIKTYPKNGCTSSVVIDNESNPGIIYVTYYENNIIGNYGILATYNGEAVTDADISDGWYLLYNHGRQSYAFDSGVGFQQEENVFESGADKNDLDAKGGFLFHISKLGETGYYDITSALGNQFIYEESGSASTTSKRYAITESSDGNYYIQDVATGYDAYGAASTNRSIVGAKAIETSDYGCCYHLIPVAFEEATAAKWLEYNADYKNKVLTGEDWENFFYPTKTSDTGVALSNFTSDSSTDDLKKLLDMIASETKFKMPGQGRYLIQVKSIDRPKEEHGDEFQETEGRYLTAYGRIMNVNDAGLDYYSIWDFTVNDDGTLTFVNEGCRDVQEPTGTTGTYMSFTIGNEALAYNTGETAASMKFTPNGKGWALMKATDDPYYCYVDNFRNRVLDGAYGRGSVDHTLCSGHTYIEKENKVPSDNMLFRCVAVSPEKDVEIFQDAVDHLTKYVGGVITLDLPDGMSEEDPLIILQKHIEEYKSIISKKGDDESSDNDGGKLFKKVYDEMNSDAMKAANYHLDLTEEKTFYLENLDRPTNFGRLYDEGTDGNILHAVMDTNEDDRYASSNANWTLTPQETIAGAWEFQNVGSQQYISKVNGDVKMTASTDESNAIAIKYEEVVPGIYRLKNGSNSDAGITIGGYGWDYCLQEYSNLELSALWKIASYCELSVQLAPDKVLTGDGTYYTTFSQPINTQVDVMDSDKKDYVITPYYADPEKVIVTEGYVDADGKAVSEGTDGATERDDITIVFTPIKSTSETGGHYLMQKEQGFFLRGNSAVPNPNVHYSTDEIEGGSDWDIKSKNMMKPVLTDKVIDTQEKYRETLVFSYVATGTRVGTGYDGLPIYGVGMGFYHLKMGRTLKANKAYISYSELESAVKTAKARGTQYDPETGEYIPKGDISVKGQNMAPRKAGSSTLSETPSLAFIFEGYHDSQEEPEIVDRIVVPVIWNATEEDMNVYDLNGRVVENPGKGIYILNGKKVLFK